jgi:purine-binding chemotaxis protein CheW
MEQILVFELGPEAYGIEINRVQEVVAGAELQDIPRAPQALLGAFNFHGGIVPVLDLAPWLGLEQRPCDPRIIVLAEEGLQLALAVSRVRRIVSVSAEQFLPWAAEGESAACIRALFHYQGDVIHVLDMPKFIESLEKLAAD